MSAATREIQEGQWVSGVSLEDEKFIGYVESVSLGSGSVKVRVTQSDRDGAIGDTVEANLSKVKKLPDYTPSSPEELNSLIELALQTHDKEWFETLSARLKLVTTAEDTGSGKANPAKRISGINRLYRLID